MNYDEFIGQVQARARLGSTGEAVRATRATLAVLGQRLFGGEVEDLAAQLPSEVGYYLQQTEASESFGLNEFFRRVSEHEGVDLPDAVHHARVVISVVQEAVTPSEVKDIRAQLPDEFDPLFEAGSEGTMDRNN